MEDLDVEQANGFEDEEPSKPDEPKMEMKQADGSERLVIEDLGEYTPEAESEEESSEEVPAELSPEGLTKEQEDEYMELLTTPESVDAGSKLRQ